MNNETYEGPCVADENHNEECPDCEGVGSHLADCTTFGPDCACNGPRVMCVTCNGEGCPVSEEHMNNETVTDVVGREDAQKSIRLAAEAQIAKSSGRTWVERSIGGAMDTITKARRATQDYGAARFIRNNADAGILGAAGLEAVRVVLDHLIDTAKTGGDTAAVEAMYALEVDLDNA